MFRRERDCLFCARATGVYTSTCTGSASALSIPDPPCPRPEPALGRGPGCPAALCASPGTSKRLSPAATPSARGALGERTSRCPSSGQPQGWFPPTSSSPPRSPHQATHGAVSKQVSKFSPATEVYPPRISFPALAQTNSAIGGKSKKPRPRSCTVRTTESRVPGPPRTLPPRAAAPPGGGRAWLLPRLLSGGAVQVSPPPSRPLLPRPPPGRTADGTFRT
ncbi:proline-rich receptor-like protein kinase PERK13 [Nannospalax galili]|uniref:proline-rich receptor-like protein kinase PERK13 n=1 Tax=Nannospalax galili TaxID=1026970 RepID=UPI00111BFC0A|nr:proline-rich receptor-like protein kinase PERK13 [Nannospalax galili]